MPKNVLAIIFIFLLLTGLCLFSYGILSIVGSTSAQGNSTWFGYGMGFSAVGAIFLIGSGVGLYKSLKPVPAQTTNTYVDLPGEMKIEEFQCKNCGGTITASNIQMKNNVPIVVCPWCDAQYQMSEKPKW